MEKMVLLFTQKILIMLYKILLLLFISLCSCANRKIDDSNKFSILWEKDSYSPIDSTIALKLISKSDIKMQIDNVCLRFKYLCDKRGNIVKSKYIYDPLCKSEIYNTILVFGDTLSINGNLASLGLYDLKLNEHYIVRYSIIINDMNVVFDAPDLYFVNSE